MRFSARYAAVAAIVCAGAILNDGFAAQNPQEQREGEGGRFLRYSSTQIWVEPTAEERAAYERARDFTLPRSSVRAALQACQAALEAQGYTRLEADPSFGLVQGVLNERLVSTGREVLRGVLKAKMGLPGKPDHQTTEALIALGPSPSPGDVLVRVRLRVTVWDSNGDSRSTIVVDPQAYRNFFAKLERTLEAAR
ncbi:hypothetical protein [Cupriavidus basilensis]|uniref:DUF3313 domain-containing protein n=1 Tax=Cupriavidus basilensis TaxID=68895 RepID=A0A643FIY3_9BURK|nr:hypothetical protein [Cupriavidus basilensis]MCP3021498.1 hypothetical protein [Cupriavidus basilensis]QOT77084.1 hypothetical protein F7R26_003040 [Cupriavidus basilensis]